MTQVSKIAVEAIVLESTFPRPTIHHMFDGVENNVEQRLDVHCTLIMVLRTLLPSLSNVSFVMYEQVSIAHLQ